MDNKKTDAQKYPFPDYHHIGRGDEITPLHTKVFAFSLRSFAYAHRHTPVCLSLVVKHAFFSCSNLIARNLQTKKATQNGGFFCLWSG